MAAQKRAQGLGDGESEHEVMAWQLAMQLSLELNGGNLKPFLLLSLA